jgi:hypothetical protein
MSGAWESERGRRRRIGVKIERIGRKWQLAESIRLRRECVVARAGRFAQFAVAEFLLAARGGSGLRSRGGACPSSDAESNC